MNILSNYLRALPVVLAIAWQSSALPLRAQQVIIGEPVQLTLNNEDLDTLIEIVAKRTGKNFIIDPRVKARVTVITASPVEVDKLYDLFLSVLEVHGFATVPAGHYIKIVPVTVATQGPLPLAADPMKTAEPVTPAQELVSHVIRIQQGTPVQSLVEALRTRVPETAKIAAAAGVNSLVITDSPENIDSLIDIVDSVLKSQ